MGVAEYEWPRNVFRELKAPERDARAMEFAKAQELAQEKVPPATVLDDAALVVDGDRNHFYGHPAENHGCTAELWTAYLRRRFGADIPALDVRAVCMLNVLQKVSRDANRPKRDNLVDIAGYVRNVEQADDRA